MGEVGGGYTSALSNCSFAVRQTCSASATP